MYNRFEDDHECSDVELARIMATVPPEPAYSSAEIAFITSQNGDEARKPVPSKTVCLSVVRDSLYKFDSAEAKRVRPRKTYVFSSLAPKVVAMLVGGGGLGKSYLTLQLMVTLSLSNNPKLAAWSKAFKIKERRTSAFISLEDSTDELHFRLQSISNHLKLDEAENDAIGTNCTFLGLGGLGFNIIGTVWQTDVATVLKERHPNGLDLLIIDTLSASHTSNENDNAEMNLVMQAFNKLARILDCAVLIIHHVAKDALKSGSANSASAARGASATTNSVRFQAAIYAPTAPPKTTKVIQGLYDAHIAFDVTKVNGGNKPKTQLWRFVPGGHGVREPVDDIIDDSKIEIKTPVVTQPKRPVVVKRINKPKSVNQEPVAKSRRMAKTKLPATGADHE